ncbi:hypothetical protein JCGZ_00388 [Jatropha curcas]|uniref:Protein LURP-one-related 10-like n=1 Tax=Jatropha curcas TaxID=180498 RepID=A0A067JFX1_JATCU|nr:hypothetical protein JCGZ_00388 [Jatropha curcas]
MAEKLSGTPLSNPNAIINNQYCVPYAIDLAVVRKVLTLDDGNFVILDVTGHMIFKVKEILPTFVHDRKHIIDVTGKTIVTLRRKAMTAHSRWQVFRGESIDTNDLIFNAKTHSIVHFKTNLDVFLANNSEEKECNFKVRGSYLERSCTIFAGAGDENSTAIVAQHTSQSILLGKDNFMVTVQPNVDFAFIVALIVILDDINHKG